MQIWDGNINLSIESKSEVQEILNFIKSYYLLDGHESYEDLSLTVLFAFTIDEKFIEMVYYLISRDGFDSDTDLDCYFE